jgi:hypothetical protein
MGWEGVSALTPALDAVAVVDSPSTEAKRKELSIVLESPLFLRSPSLAYLLSYLCERTFSGESDQIKEYSVALDVFGPRESVCCVVAMSHHAAPSGDPAQ